MGIPLPKIRNEDGTYAPVKDRGAMAVTSPFADVDWSKAVEDVRKYSNQTFMNAAIPKGVIYDPYSCVRYGFGMDSAEASNSMKDENDAAEAAAMSMKIVFDSMYGVSKEDAKQITIDRWKNNRITINGVDTHQVLLVGGVSDGTEVEVPDIHKPAERLAMSSYEFTDYEEDNKTFMTPVREKYYLVLVGGEYIYLHEELDVEDIV